MLQLARRAFVLILLLALALPVMAQDAAPLTPFTDETFEIRGVMPEGWTSVGPGLYARASSAGDVTLLALQTAPASAQYMLQSLLPQFGLTEAPQPVGSAQSASFEWTLYQFEYAQSGLTLKIDLALAEQDGVTYAALLQAAPDEYEQLHADIFQPVLDSLEMLEVVTEPVPYIVEEVTFANGDVTLAGTLTLPEAGGAGAQRPAIVLMTGSGPQTRDEEVIPGFPIFEQIADTLTRQGIAVLRYDDRGVGQSGGDFTTASVYDFAADGKAAVAYLRGREDINPDAVGVLGHSEGGIYAAMLGGDPDSGAAFIITLAGTAVSGEATLLHQTELVMRGSGVSEAVVESQLEYTRDSFPLIHARDWDGIEAMLMDLLRRQWAMLTPEEQEALGGDVEHYAQETAASTMSIYQVEWLPTMLEYDPGVDWAKTTVPVLAIFGGLDVQVDDAQQVVPLTEALVQAGNRDFAIVVLPNANHLFQEAETGALAEYATLPPEFTPDLLPTVAEWLHQRVEVVQ